ncbi:MAG: MFS transporter [Acidimicrobiales bacterium]
MPGRGGATRTPATVRGAAAPVVQTAAVRAWLDGRSALPLAVLTGLNLVDELDRIAFAALAPEIRDAFRLSDASIGTLAIASSAVILFIAAPVGVLADRLSRVRIALVCGVLWGTMSVATGLAGGLVLLAAARVLSGVGRNANEIVHPSLLTDLYPPSTHPRVFQVHRIANPAAAASGIVAGAIGAWWSWRAAFVLLAAPTFLLLILLRRVPEPGRGATGGSRPALGPRPPFGEAFRRLAGIVSLRRFWAAGFFLGGVYASYTTLVSLFFEQVHGYGPFGRGVAQFALGAGTVAGLVLGAGASRREVPAPREPALRKSAYPSRPSWKSRPGASRASTCQAFVEIERYRMRRAGRKGIGRV